jgi:hypothetical protein
MKDLGLLVGRLPGERLGELSLRAALHGDTVDRLRLLRHR